MQYFWCFAWVCCLAAFLTWPAIILFIRFSRRRWMPWYLLAFCVGVVGWMLWGLQIAARNAYLDYIVMGVPSPDRTDPLVREWEADGARNLFALLFGWALSTIYFLPWFGIYGAACLVRMMRHETVQHRNSHNGEANLDQPS